MAKKKRAIPKGQLGDWGDEIPDDLREAADAYDMAHTTRAKAVGKLNSAKETLIEQMRKTGIERVRIRNGDKVLVIDFKDKIKYTKPGEVPAG